MLTGHVFKTGSPFPGVVIAGGFTITIPQGSILTVLQGPAKVDGTLLKIAWRDKRLFVFTRDLQARANDVTGALDTRQELAEPAP